MEPQKLRPELKRYMYQIFTENIYSACNPMQIVVSYKHVLIFLEERLKFSHFEGSIIPLTLFMIGLFRVVHGWDSGGGAKKSLPQICHTYSIMMKLGTVIPYLKKIKKIFESREALL